MPRRGLWVSPNTFVEFSGKPASLSAQIATRERSIDFTALSGYLPNPDPVLKRVGKDITVYRELLADAHVSACVESRRAGVLSLLWAIDRGKSKSRQAKFIEEVFESLDVTQIISDALEGALFGYQPLEVVWESENSRVIPVDVSGKPPEWFLFGENGDLRFKTMASWTGESLPERKFLCALHRASYANPYGSPALGPCFWPAIFKKGGVKFWVTFAEKYGMPWVIAKHQPGISAGEKDEILDMLEAMVRDGISVLPENASVEFKESANRGASMGVFSGLIELCNAEISKALLGQTLTTEVGTTGSYAASKTHGGIRQDIVNSDRRMVESVMNELIDWVCWLNFGDSQRPRFELYAEEDVDAELAKRDLALSQTGQIQFSKTYWQRAYGFSDDEIEARVPQKEPAPIGAAFAEGKTARAPLDAVDPIVERLLDAAPMDALIEPIRKLVEQCSSFDELREKLLDTYGNMDDKSIARILELALQEASLSGRAQVLAQAKEIA